MKLLLTGFEPFGESKINPSEQVVRAREREKIAGIELRMAILPVDRVRGPETLIRAVQQLQPDAVLCLGEASRRIAISIERVAINLMDFRIADDLRKPFFQPGGTAHTRMGWVRSAGICHDAEDVSLHQLTAPSTVFVFGSSGKHTENALPVPTPSLCAVIVPPCASTSDLTIANPNPDSELLW